MWCFGSLVKTGSSMYGRVKIRERRGIETIVRRYKEDVFVVSYLAVWPNISMEMGRVVDTTSLNFSFSWRC